MTANLDLAEQQARTVQCVTCAARTGQACIRVTPVGRIKSRLAHPLRYISAGGESAWA